MGRMVDISHVFDSAGTNIATREALERENAILKARVETLERHLVTMKRALETQRGVGTSEAITLN